VAESGALVKPGWALPLGLLARSPLTGSGVDEITAIIPTEEFMEPLPTAA
jgi:hypothetical protein